MSDMTDTIDFDRLTAPLPKRAREIPVPSPDQVARDWGFERVAGVPIGVLQLAIDAALAPSRQALVLKQAWNMLLRVAMRDDTWERIERRAHRLSAQHVAEAWGLTASLAVALLEIEKAGRASSHDDMVAHFRAAMASIKTAIDVREAQALGDVVRK